jgi:DNA repair protein RadC
MFKNQYREIAVVVGLDNTNKLNVAHLVGVGSLSEAAVYPANVFRPLLLSNSAHFVFLHNHPGSTLRPSDSDRQLTATLKEIGKLLALPMLDSIILNADASDHYSFATSGLLATF